MGLPLAGPGVIPGGYNNNNHNVNNNVNNNMINNDNNNSWGAFPGWDGELSQGDMVVWYCQEWEIDQLLQSCMHNFMFVEFAWVFMAKYLTNICRISGLIGPSRRGIC